MNAKFDFYPSVPKFLTAIYNIYISSITETEIKKTFWPKNQVPIFLGLPITNMLSDSWSGPLFRGGGDSVRLNLFFSVKVSSFRVADHEYEYLFRYSIWTFVSRWRTLSVNKVGFFNLKIKLRFFWVADHKYLVRVSI